VKKIITVAKNRNEIFKQQQLGRGTEPHPMPHNPVRGFGLGKSGMARIGRPSPIGFSPVARHPSTILIEGSMCLVLFRPQCQEGGADYRVGQPFRNQ
jgi:hypothetical protein